jgi:diaminopimelate epimerase
MRFSKYHGTGNDFILVDDMLERGQWSPATIAAACDRRFGIGADGVIRIAPAEDADFFMDYSNADGQTAEMCGNGIRCLGKYVFDRGLTTSRQLLVATRAGLKHLVLHVEDGRVEAVTVDMGRPALTRGAIPMAGDPESTFVGQPLEVDGRTLRGTAVSMGNPHVVLFLDPSGDGLSEVPVRVLGPMVEGRAEFPERTNVEFVTVRDGRVLARVWERGSGETMACGTGGCAAMVASSLAGLVDRTAEVEFPGGVLRVAWREDGTVELTGPAACVFDGELDREWLRATAEAALR